MPPRVFTRLSLTAALFGLVALSTGAGLLAATSSSVQASNTTLSNLDVIKMTQVGLSDEVIVMAVEQATAKAFDLTPNGLVQLKTSGVSDVVIAAMMSDGTSPPTGPMSTRSREVVIGDGTELKVRLVRPITSETAQVDDRVDFESAHEIVADGTVVIEKGAPAWGKVIKAQKSRSFGRRGSLDFTIDYVEAIDGQNVRLRVQREAEGDERYGAAGVVTILTGPFGWFVKGKNVELGAGTEFTIFIDGDLPIQLEQGR